MNQNPAPVSSLYTVIRGQIEHINNTLNQRIIWLVIAQSFFFNGFALLVTAKPPNPPLYEKLLWIFPIAALLSVILTFVDVMGSLIYLRKLRKWYNSKPKDDGIEKAYPPIAGYKNFRILEHVSPTVLPIVFIITWIYILIFHAGAQS
jgi:hypothetical protein